MWKYCVCTQSKLCTETYGCLFEGFVSVHCAKWEVKLAACVKGYCVKGLCQCKLYTQTLLVVCVRVFNSAAEYWSLLVVCDKGLCQCTVHALYSDLLVVCTKGLCQYTVHVSYSNLLVICVKVCVSACSVLKSVGNLCEGLCQCMLCTQICW